MTSVIQIGNSLVRLSATAGVLVRYKAQFGTDYIADAKAIYNEDKSFNAEQFLMTGYRLLWTMAKIADDTILPPDEWAVSLGEFDLEKALSAAQELFGRSLGTEKNTADSEDRQPLTAESLIAYAAISKITIADLDKLPLPTVLDSIKKYIHLKYGGKEEREAVQADFDNF